MAGTIEYHNPLGKSDYLSIQHLERYKFSVSRLKPGQRLLDIACGAGYGTALLLKHGCKAIGADYDEQAVADAQTKYKYGNFVRADVLEIPFKDESFDVVVSFETIEHVHDGNSFLSEVYRVLKPGGTFLCSTPNLRYTAHPPYHVKEYCPEEFYGLVEQRFSQVERYGQYFKPLDRASDLYHRHFHAFFVSLLEKTNIKKTSKCILRPAVRKGSENPECQSTGDLMIGQAFQGNGNSYYRVRPFINTKRLRIMVVAAKKGTD
ncbi:MAG: class I SAM-dependent methyltransferase [Candidatus Brocadia sp.]|nr:class I SAM-dependent methyltransferase [Candidatus Brocadia sp.]